MPLTIESSKDFNKPKVGVLVKRRSSSSDIGIISPRSRRNSETGITSPRSKKNSRASFSEPMSISSPKSPRLSKVQSSEEVTTTNSNELTFMERLKEGFSVCQPLYVEDIDIQGAKHVEKAKEGKKMSLMSSRALSEYGAHLSEEKNDHQAAIVTLMRVRTKISFFLLSVFYCFQLMVKLKFRYCYVR